MKRYIGQGLRNSQTPNFYAFSLGNQDASFSIHIRIFTSQGASLSLGVQDFIGFHYIDMIKLSDHGNEFNFRLFLVHEDQEVGMIVCGSKPQIF